MPAPLKLSVVVPTYNRRDVLVSQTLPAISNQDFPADEYEVIAIVDGSTDGTIESPRSLRPQCALRLLEQPNRGPNVARNYGTREARSKLVLFLDDNIVCGPNLLRQHVAAHAGADPVVVYGSTFLAPGTPPSVLKYANETWHKEYYGRLDLQQRLKWPEGIYLVSNSSLPLSSLLSCGGFDENRPAKEDYELGLRPWKMGMWFHYLPSAVAYEFLVKPSRHFLHNDGEIYGRTEVLLCRKHPRLPPAFGAGTTWKDGVVEAFPAAGCPVLPSVACPPFCRAHLDA